MTIFFLLSKKFVNRSWRQFSPQKKVCKHVLKTILNTAKYSTFPRISSHLRQVQGLLPALLHLLQNTLHCIWKTQLCCWIINVFALLDQDVLGQPMFGASRTCPLLPRQHIIEKQRRESWFNIGTVLVLWQPPAYTSDQLPWFTVAGFQFLSGDKVGESSVLITMQKLCFTKISKMVSLENNSIWLFW